MHKPGILYREQVPPWVTVDGRMGNSVFNPASPVFHSGVKPVYRLTGPRRDTRSG